jgi:hypothetical protein
LDSQVITDFVVLVGSSLGATGAALVPYWQKVRQNEALGLPAITFDKKFMGTLVIAFVVGVSTAFITFNSVDASVNPSDTLVKIFIVAVITSATSNVTLNSFIAPGSVTQTAIILKAQNQVLKDEVATLKSATGTGTGNNKVSLPLPVLATPADTLTTVTSEGLQPVKQGSESSAVQQ